MTHDATLRGFQKHWPESSGKAYLNERVTVRGRDLHRDLGHMDWFAYHLLVITGREFSRTELALLNYIWVSTSYPDPSIWPNHTTALGGSARTSPGLALSAGLAGSESLLFGGVPLRKSIDFYQRLASARAEGVTLEDFVEQDIERQGRIYGFGRPLASVDERVPHTLTRARELGFGEGRHLLLALEVGGYLAKTRGIGMNIVAVDGALGADMGFTPLEFQLYMNLCFYAGQTSCYLDALRQPEGCFFPIPCDSVNYQGPEPRSWVRRS